jgi:hypothetical protein
VTAIVIIVRNFRQSKPTAAGCIMRSNAHLLLCLAQHTSTSGTKYRYRCCCCCDHYHCCHCCRFANQTIFLAFTVLLCSVIGGLIGLPVMTTSVISAFIWGSSRVNPTAVEPFQFGLSVPRYLMPFALAGIDVLQVNYCLTGPLTWPLTRPSAQPLLCCLFTNSQLRRVAVLSRSG